MREARWDGRDVHVATPYLLTVLKQAAICRYKVRYRMRRYQRVTGQWRHGSEAIALLHMVVPDHLVVCPNPRTQ